MRNKIQIFKENIMKIHCNEWELDKGAKPQGSLDGFWYDITNGGHIQLEKLIENPEQLRIVREAIDNLWSLQQALEENGLLNEF
jgi:hypothetical protein